MNVASLLASELSAAGQRWDAGFAEFLDKQLSDLAGGSKNRHSSHAHTAPSIHVDDVLVAHTQTSCPGLSRSTFPLEANSVLSAVIGVTVLSCGRVMG